MNRFTWTDDLALQVAECWRALGSRARPYEDGHWEGLDLDPLPQEEVHTLGYYSQLGQDVLLDRCLFDRREHGVFVDVGAHDGLSLSNSAALERERAWSGLLIEPNPDVFAVLKSQRRSTALNLALGAERGQAEFTVLTGYSQMLSGLTLNYVDEHRARIERELREHGGETRSIAVRVAPLQEILEEHGIDHVDVLMIDTEGSELSVLAGLDLRKTSVDVILVEENYGGGPVQQLLMEQEYLKRIRIGWDSLYFWCG
jgi:FkbM family methyltransferase